MLATYCAFAFAVFACLVSYPLLKYSGSRGFYLLAGLFAGAFISLTSLLGSVVTGKNTRLHLEWLPTIGLDFTLYIDLYSLLLALLVTGGGALILCYCAGYFAAKDPNTARFGLVFSSFALSMLGLVVADNLLLLFSFWEATTVLSYLLIGHNGKKRTSRAAAQQAIIVTTFGGLAMLVGFLIIMQEGASPNLSQVLQQLPTTPLTTVAVFLILAGALSKSAIFPLHFWLPQAMAAPTPVSAYLHAAAMVKAGIYLLARLSVAIGHTPGYRETLVLLGAVTMLLAALRALKQYDLKLILAYGTVSQLGMLTMLYGTAQPAIMQAATLLLFAHALAKAPLFLTVGIIEYRTGTRDLRKISGLARRDRLLAVLASLAGFSLMGGFPLLGFVAKEAALTELLQDSANELYLIALGVLLLGSLLTAAYTLRFLLGAFNSKERIKTVTLAPAKPSMVLPVAVFTLAALFGGIFAGALDPLYQKTLVVAGDAAHLALLHGFTPALGLSVTVLLLGAVAAVFAGIRRSRLWQLPEQYSASAGYFRLMRRLDNTAVFVTSLTQRGSLPFYLAIILGTLALVASWLLWFTAVPFANTAPVTFEQTVLALVLIVSAIATARAKKRFQAVILVGISGFAMAVLFALNGAPDLALTQMLVEAITLITFVLVIRRLPQRLANRASTKTRLLHLAIGAGVGLVIAFALLAALAAQQGASVADIFADLAVTGGHGYNIVNVTLVDIRGWDTFGELSVVVVAATGIASLVFLSNRADNLPKLPRKAQVAKQLTKPAAQLAGASRSEWLLAGNDLSPGRRSIILEVVVRLLFHPLLLLSVYLLLAGHNSPGGGFAGGLVAGMALVARYLAGGRTELGATVPFDAGKIVGLGMALAALTALAPVFFGQPALYSSWIDLDLGLLGKLSLVTSTVFDIGVYLIVFGLVLDVLRSLGAQIDVHSEQERARVNSCQ